MDSSSISGKLRIQVFHYILPTVSLTALPTKYSDDHQGVNYQRKAPPFPNRGCNDFHQFFRRTNRRGLNGESCSPLPSAPSKQEHPLYFSPSTETRPRRDLYKKHSGSYSTGRNSIERSSDRFERTVADRSEPITLGLSIEAV